MNLMIALLAAASAAQQQKIDSVHWLIGTWSCHHTVGTFAGDYKTTFQPALGGIWVRQTYDFPSDAEEPARQADSFIGYDPRRQYWVRFFAMSTGEWFATRMNETANGWAWKYVSFSKDRKPETGDADATFTHRSDTEYEIQGPSYDKGGVRVTEHHVCRKM